MGRTLKTMNQLIRKEESDLKNFRRALYKADQKLFDQLFVGVKKRSTPISMIDHALPFESMLLAMNMEQQEEINRLKLRLELLERNELG